MFLVYTKHVMVSSLKRVFDNDYREPDFRNLHVSIEYPLQEVNYPGVWVDFETGTTGLQTVGIGHREIGLTAKDATGYIEYRRWRFQGEATFTIAALSSLERDRLFDELVAVLAFGHETGDPTSFRENVQNNEFVALDCQWDSLSARMPSASPGTPWGNDHQVIYEATLTLETIGEFVSDGSSQALVPLRDVEVYPYAEGEEDPIPTGNWM